MVLLMAALLGACGEDNGVDYCKNHYAYHSDHLASLGNLTIELSDAGDLDGNLSLPDVVLHGMADDDVSRIFAGAENTFTLQTEATCEVGVQRFARTAEGLEATFEANCGPDQKIGQISVALFDHLEALEELVVAVTTPATSKRFGISRQCDGPIFRLE